MLVETVKILRIENERILVEAQESAHCSSCSASSACGHRLLSKLDPHRSRQLNLIRDNFHGKVGDLVEIGLDESALLQLSLSFYLLPLLSMIITVLIFDFLAFNEALLILAALSGLALGFLGLGIITRNYK